MEKIWELAKSELKNGNSYEASEILTKKLSELGTPDSIYFGIEKAKAFLEYGLNDTACNVSIFFIKKARKAKLALKTCTFDDIMDVLIENKTFPEKDKLIENALSWCLDDEERSKDKILKLSYWSSKYYFDTGNYPRAQFFAFYTEDAVLYSKIIYEWTKLGYSSEKELFLLRAVLSLLSIGKLEFANELYDKYCDLVESKPSPEWTHGSAPSAVMLAYYFIRACDGSDNNMSFSIFTSLINDYPHIIQIDKTFSDFIRDIKERYFPGKIFPNVKDSISDSNSILDSTEPRFKVKKTVQE
ncbi:putative apicomplexan conserved [Cryptosporidium xiaoi]|uniref:Apicomplexan conserved n=1 Tax=Cryptosporidium xiaoi TaxID=659607 RepID=A0AAV9XZV6_9CRYT